MFNSLLTHSRTLTAEIRSTVRLTLANFMTVKRHRMKFEIVSLLDNSYSKYVNKFCDIFEAYILEYFN